MMWRCPHCGTPQAEAARCWVCRRPSTSCATCRYFGRAVASGLGFCLLDRWRRVRRGNELEACWTAPVPGDPLPPPAPIRTPVLTRRSFVPLLDDSDQVDASDAARQVALPAGATDSEVGSVTVATDDARKVSPPTPEPPPTDGIAGFWPWLEA